MEMDSAHSPQAEAGPSRLRDRELHQDHDTDMQQARETGAAAAAAEHEHEDNADGEGDVLYYVDADGNPIDPAEMGEYALALQEGDQATGGLAGEASLGMDVDEHVHSMLYAESGRVTEHTESPTAVHDSSTIAQQPEEQQHEEGEEQHSQDTERYRRPFIPPREHNTSNSTNDQARPPDYAVKYTITGHRKNVSCIRFSPDGKYLITAGELRV
jgi:hypothetical protein